jgi:hypothetical protein
VGRRRKLYNASRLMLGAACENRMNRLAQDNHDKRVKRPRNPNFMGIRSAPLKRPRDGSRGRIVAEVAKEASEKWGEPITPRMVTRCWVESHHLRHSPLILNGCKVIVPLYAQHKAQQRRDNRGQYHLLPSASVSRCPLNVCDTSAF